MELELLKEIWEETGHNPANNPASGDAILEMAKKADLSMVSRMRRNLLFEVIVVLVCVTAIALFYFAAFNGKLREVSWMYIMIAAGFLFYYYRKNVLLKRMQCPVCDIRSNLERQLKTLEKYVRLYLIGGTVLVPAVLAAFYILVQHKHIIILPFSNISAGRGLVLYIILSVVLTTASFFFHRWYIFKLYGRYIQRLKQTLEEMNG
ncbi:MAG: hypothetical protein J0H29_19130 [Sphingobacteriales bacterium]|nr:hypothetical protein [Sphingobacteriales bacterium]OJY87333.1 MAG: hypothetical protein BGP14_09530 [Sphingobacteriales bacterium 44-15]